MRILLGQVLPASTAPQNPQNPFQDTAVVDPRTATLAVLARLGKQGSDFLPLHFRQQRTRPGHRPSFGAADFAYLASEKTQLPSFQEPVLGYATASSDSNGRGRVDTVGFKLAEGKGLREGWDSKELWKSVEKVKTPRFEQQRLLAKSAS